MGWYTVCDMVMKKLWNIYNLALKYLLGLLWSYFSIWKAYGKNRSPKAVGIQMKNSYIVSIKGKLTSCWIKMIENKI